MDYSFKDIFKEEGIYISDNCEEGECFLIRENKLTTLKEIHFCIYASAFDVNPTIKNLVVYDLLFEHEYKKINNIFELFDNKGVAHP
jgi:hypothetical protein